MSSSSSKLLLSIVSHGQWSLVKKLLADLAKLPSQSNFSVVLTLNTPESIDLLESDYPFPIEVLKNQQPKGFGENHNQAFYQSRDKGPFDYFVVLNPDIRISDDPFQILLSESNLAQLEPRNSIGVMAPRIVNSEGQREDSAREIPTPGRILAKIFGERKSWPIPKDNSPFFPDWVAGMFMVFSRQAFEDLGGFNTSYFLYYEDVEICSRLWLNSYRVIVVPEASVCHDAQRESHRKTKYLIWHITSMLRFFTSSTFFKVKHLHLGRGASNG